MATPKPGEIRCPTCHRSTPPAAYCTQCGSAIPADARARPRGMDRAELQDRIRARRSGADPYRRGSVAGDDPVYERFEPTAEDEGARRARRSSERRFDRLDPLDDPPLPASAAAAAAAAREAQGEAAPTASVDRPLTREPDDWSTPAATPPPPGPERRAAVEPVVPASDPPELSRREARRQDEATDDDVAYPADAYADAPYDESGDPYGYEYDTWQEPERRSSGAGAFAILGFLALGVLALLGGAFLAGVFDDDGVAQVTPSASVAASQVPVESTAPSVAASAVPSGVTGGSATPVPSGEPVVFPDGFTALAEPCIPGSVRSDGCDENGVRNNGQVEIWVGFENGGANDVVGADLIGPDGASLGGQSIDLADIGCQSPCNGYTYFNFSNLGAGTYQVRITRNGDFASQTTFEVS